MRKKLLTLIISFILYAIAFQAASYLFELYLIHIKGPVIPIILLEQSLIPFVFGFITYKYIKSDNVLSPLLMLMIPITLIVPTTIWDIIKGEDVTIFEHTFMFSVIVVMQLIFITLGAYLQFYKKA